ncbi:hypothetical protein COW36_23025 [bacterium (Candidatus Blackallbacteria) CG17_big_fil_post_rev_8_21_14_2_50_48_46]|uniref:histidine kinase n=1 Tax=bacterium (Candidatus Blackallbacteria) CG17_big_fil_post_rev_8_21_14_2_50_48_46 TaxID=2014261 RepID=A0A2M7FXV4_9BACT|nr:MAG: hypothetical protein COW64_16095 [bacterium (Candidatus Blackallbacteria) CG18_big_fil_WC_8_21_14_2_50_49_26]PIW14124.1 MAG: hypothetical protein COW36_23025 [bacterium (Candidatus Blackallbacteria) CG17_big_fil_post_rev_8_21_14_2_50_48_46]PIW45854.1 MAG: hypothetical protein COW20_18690 [bacterium (Candidatus Blackallbacteria) CG13_big_fil_rev_8_21_14_2_50_49_14]
MGNYTDFSREDLLARIAELESENVRLCGSVLPPKACGATVSVPEALAPIFERAQNNVQRYFQNLEFRPEQGMIEVDNERYVLIRASSLSCDFFNYLSYLYSDRDLETAFQTGQDFLFDIGHVLGIEDAKSFHARMHLQDPIEKLSAGPVHFAYAGWGFVEILPESRPVPNEHFFLKYNHPYSFEADSWISRGQRSQDTVCIMNAAYSSGWCEASFGLPLTAVEISCRARGDAACSFIMAPPDKIHLYLQAELSQAGVQEKSSTPLFFNRKLSEELIRASLQEKKILLQEIHHRVKNNLQLVVSLITLQIKLLQNLESEESLRCTQRRIAAIAMIHEMLYESENFSQIPYREYIERLLTQSLRGMSDGATPIALKLELEDISLKMDTAIPLGLILNELTTNALKHAFADTFQPEIQVSLSELAPRKFKLHFCDNGSGLPKDLQIDTLSSLGLRLILNLVRQLQGELEIIPQGRGTCFQICFEEGGGA